MKRTINTKLHKINTKIHKMAEFLKYKLSTIFIHNGFYLLYVTI